MSSGGNPNASPLSGILVVDKRLRLSSMSVVSTVRYRARRAKTGHAGTLDPMASGVLVLAVGKATKTIPRLMETTKRYRTEVDLAHVSASDDRETELEPVAVATPPDRAAIDRALAAFRGTFMQRPPNFSAIQVNGRRAYNRARQGDDFELPARPVVVFDLTIAAYAWPVVTLDLWCAKGFYVRSLARALGEVLGTGGTCRSIRRTAVGPFTLDRAISLDDVPDPLTEADLISIDDAFAMVENDVVPPPAPAAPKPAT